MRVTRVVPNVAVRDVSAATTFYSDLLGLDIGMDHGWIGTCVGDQSAVQLSVITEDATAPVNPVISVGVDDIEEAYRRATAAGLEIVHPLTDEPWGVRRFFLRDPDGNVINIVAHR
ncbi:MAG: VOC family protein [Jatrophihabitans sp.]